MLLLLLFSCYYYKPFLLFYSTATVVVVLVFAAAAQSIVRRCVGFQITPFACCCCSWCCCCARTHSILLRLTTTGIKHTPDPYTFKILNLPTFYLVSSRNTKSAEYSSNERGGRNGSAGGGGGVAKGSFVMKRNVLGIFHCNSHVLNANIIFRVRNMFLCLLRFRSFGVVVAFSNISSLWESSFHIKIEIVIIIIKFPSRFLGASACCGGWHLPDIVKIGSTGWRWGGSLRHTGKCAARVGERS